jgi:methionyl-tRNA formyltransferase
VKVWQAQLRTGRHSAEAPGTVLAQTPEALEVVGGDGQVLALLQLQRPGGKRQAAAAFHQARPGLVGRCLASA